MQRSTVVLALEGDTHPYAAALESAGFDVISDAAAIDARLSDGPAPDLAVLDCSLDSAAKQYFGLHGNPSVPTLLIFDDDLPAFATDTESHSARDEYAMKPLPVDALVYRVQALQIRYNRPGSDADAWRESDQAASRVIGEGHVVSVFAPKGGVGKTTIAVNLAVALRQQTHARVLLLDADVGVGNVTSVLDVPHRLGLAGLVDSPKDDWTDAAFEQAVATHEATGVEVLSWGDDPAQSQRISDDLLLQAVRWARTNYSYVVIDNHPSYDDRTMAMLATSREILLVVTPEVGPIRSATKFLEVARLIGLGDAIKVVVNRANHGVSMADVAQALGKPITATVVSNGPKAVAAANEGTPMVTRFPKERMSADLQTMARLLTHSDGAAPRKARSWLGAFAPGESAA